MADLAELEVALAEAKLAQAKLVNGSRVERIESPDGSYVQYAAVDLDTLREYIAEIEADIRRANGLPGNPPVYIAF